MFLDQQGVEGNYMARRGGVPSSISIVFDIGDFVATGVSFVEFIRDGITDDMFPTIGSRMRDRLIEDILKNYHGEQIEKSYPIEASGELGNEIADVSNWGMQINKQEGEMSLSFSPSPDALQLNQSAKTKLEAIEFGTPAPQAHHPFYDDQGRKVTNEKFGGEVEGVFRHNIGAWMAQKGIPSEWKFPIMQKIMGMERDEFGEGWKQTGVGGTRPANPRLMMGDQPPGIFLEGQFPNLVLNTYYADEVFDKIIEEEVNSLAAAANKIKGKRKSKKVIRANVPSPRFISWQERRSRGGRSYTVYVTGAFDAKGTQIKGMQTRQIVWDK